MEQARPDSTDQIEEEIRYVPEEIFDIVAEDPEKEHVSGEVQEAGVKKHAGYQGHEGYFKAGMAHQEGGEPSRNRGVRKEQGFKGAVRKGDFGAELVNKHNAVGKDQRDIDERLRARRAGILQRGVHGRSAADEKRDR